MKAKAATHVGSGREARSSRPGAHEIPDNEGRFEYLDSYVGDSSFLKQEIVTCDDTIAWAMDRHGNLLRPELVTAAEAGAVSRITGMERLDRDGEQVDELVYHGGLVRE